MLRSTLILAAVLLLPLFLAGADRGNVKEIASNDDPTRQTDADWVDARWQKTDVGQFLCAAVETPGQKTPKGIAIKVGDRDEGTVCFDTDTLRYSAGWLGGFLDLQPKRFGLLLTPRFQGTVQFASAVQPGWSLDGSFKDPRPQRHGPLPKSVAHYRGMYLHGKRVVLSYTVGRAKVLESPWLETRDQVTAFTRTLQITSIPEPMTLHLCDAPKGAARIEERDGVPIAVLTTGSEVTSVALAGKGVTLEVATNNASARVRVAAANSARFHVFILRGPESTSALASLVKTAPTAIELEPLARGGPANWNQTLVTRGSLGIGTGPLLIDTLTMPYENPWRALMFASGHDFFSNGDVAVSTAHGDVWRVSGVDARLQKLSWKRFATGLHQPLGLKIVNHRVHVLCRDGIIIPRDLNGDGEADFYENFNNDAISAGGGHSYSTCLETDAAGNFYFLKCAEETPHGGALLRVSKDGSRLDVIATGFRNPNGLGIGPDDFITVGDQQGEWVPETRLDWIQPGGFYGYMPMHKRATKPATYDPPLCWITRTVDNSAGGDVWIPENRWSSLGGRMIHLSYGRCTMMLVLRDELNPSQGAVVPLPGRFLSGVMRARFNPRDDALYLSGLRGWQTSALRDGSLQRVRYTGAPFQLPTDFAVYSNGIRLTFSQPLDRATAENPDSFAAVQWNFRWSANYGSPDFSARNSEKQGRDELKVTAARLLEDGRSVFITIDDLLPAMQTELKYNVRSATGTPIRGETYLTIHRLAAAWKRIETRPQ